MPVTNTNGMIRLALNAEGRNRSVHEDEFIAALDPDGVHVLAFQFIHNDVEMRTQWLCKMNEQESPAEVWLDVDFDVLDAVVSGVSV